MAKFQEGEVFVYANGSRYELGVVKRACGDDNYFCYYSEGDTAANTPASNMFKLANSASLPINHIKHW